MAIENDTYLSIEKICTGEFKDRGSKFIGFAFPVSSEDEVKDCLAEIRKLHPTAGHVCYAFRINPLNEYYRTNDDGEPSSTAGKPILGQIRSLNLQNILVAVVRYFGGTLLGVSGLINAYKETAAIALNEAVITEKQITVSFKLNVDYVKMGEVMKWIKDSKYAYSTPIMADTFIVNIEVPYFKQKVMKDFFIEKDWMESV
jgi:uncharacterized YigZ family protein